MPPLSPTPIERAGMLLHRGLRLHLNGVAIACHSVAEWLEIYAKRRFERRLAGSIHELERLRGYTRRAAYITDETDDCLDEAVIALRLVRAVHCKEHLWRPSPAAPMLDDDIPF